MLTAEDIAKDFDILCAILKAVNVIMAFDNIRDRPSSWYDNTFAVPVPEAEIEKLPDTCVPLFPAQVRMQIMEAFRKFVMATLHEAAMQSSCKDVAMKDYIREVVVGNREIPDLQIDDLMKAIKKDDIRGLDAEMQQLLVDAAKIRIHRQLLVAEVQERAKRKDLMQLLETQIDVVTAAYVAATTSAKRRRVFTSDEISSNLTYQERRAIIVGATTSMIAFARTYRGVVAWFKPTPFKKAIENSGAKAGIGNRNGRDYKDVRDLLLFTYRTTVPRKQPGDKPRYSEISYVFDMDAIDYMYNKLTPDMVSLVDKYKEYFDRNAVTYLTKQIGASSQVDKDPELNKKIDKCLKDWKM